MWRMVRWVCSSTDHWRRRFHSVSGLRRKQHTLPHCYGRYVHRRSSNHARRLVERLWLSVNYLQRVVCWEYRKSLDLLDTSKSDGGSRTIEPISTLQRVPQAPIEVARACGIVASVHPGSGAGPYHKSMCPSLLQA